MALIVPGHVQANGKLGDIVFFRSRWGSVVRTRNPIVQANSPQQLAIRGSFTALAAAWQSLPRSSKLQWEAFAYDQDPVNFFEYVYRSKGMQEFMKRNINLQKIGQPQLLLPAGNGRIQSITKVTPQPGDAWAWKFGWEHEDGTITLGPSKYMVVSSTINRSSHSRDPDPPYRQTIVYPPGTSSPQNFAGAWAATWAPTVGIPGMRVFMSCQNVDAISGLAGTKVFASGLLA